MSHAAVKRRHVVKTQAVKAQEMLEWEKNIYRDAREREQHTEIVDRWEACMKGTCRGKCKGR